MPTDQTRKALHSLWRYNFTPDVGPFRQGTKVAGGGGREYALAGEGGLVMCTFPDPEHPIPIGAAGTAIYFNECMTGLEHQVAAHMIWEGGDLVEKGLASEARLQIALEEEVVISAGQSLHIILG